MALTRVDRGDIMYVYIYCVCKRAKITSLGALLCIREQCPPHMRNVHTQKERERESARCQPTLLQHQSTGSSSSSGSNRKIKN